MTRTLIVRRTAGIGLAVLALGVPATTAAARPIEDNAIAASVPVSPPALTSSNASTQVRPNPDQQIARDGARIPPILQRVHGSELAAMNLAKQQTLANHVPPSGRYSTAEFNSPATVKPAMVSAPSAGFHWGDAAIGAAAAAAIALLGIGGAVAVRQRRQLPMP